MSTHFGWLWSENDKRKLNKERMVGKSVGEREVNNSKGAREVKGNK